MVLKCIDCDGYGVRATWTVKRSRERAKRSTATEVALLARNMLYNKSYHADVNAVKKAPLKDVLAGFVFFFIRQGLDRQLLSHTHIDSLIKTHNLD